MLEAVRGRGKVKQEGIRSGRKRGRDRGTETVKGNLSKGQV